MEKQLKTDLEIPKGLYGGFPNYSSSVVYSTLKQGKVKHFVISPANHLQRISIDELETQKPFFVYLDRSSSWQILGTVIKSISTNNQDYFYVAYEGSISDEYCRVRIQSPSSYENITRLVLHPDESLELVLSGKSQRYSDYKDPKLHSDILEIVSAETSNALFLEGVAGVSVNNYLLTMGSIKKFTDLDVYIRRNL